jgi:hypothetical protein
MTLVTTAPGAKELLSAPETVAKNEFIVLFAVLLEERGDALGERIMPWCV